MRSLLLQHWQVHPRFTPLHCGLSGWLSFQRLGPSQRSDICQVTHPQRWHHGGVSDQSWVCHFASHRTGMDNINMWAAQLESRSQSENTFHWYLVYNANHNWFSSHLSAKQDSVITHWLLISTDSLWGGEQRPVIFFWHETKLFSLRFLFHVYIMKNMETCIHSMDPEAHWLTLSAQVWASEGTRTLTTMSTGQQEKQVLDWRSSEVNRYTYKTVIYLDEFSPSCCRF